MRKNQMKYKFVKNTPAQSAIVHAVLKKAVTGQQSREDVSASDERVKNARGSACLWKSTFKRGFTLIELLVVVLIIAILAAVAIPQYQTAVDKSRFVQLMVFVKSIKDAQEIYYMANGSYSSRLDELDISLPPGASPTDGVVRYSNGLGVSIMPNYVYAFDFSRLDNSLVLPYTHSESEESVYVRGHFTCQAAQGNARAQRLCKSLGGTDRGSASGCFGGPCTYYLLP